MRIACGEIVQETDTFTPARTGLESFEAYGIYQGDALLERPDAHPTSSLSLTVTALRP